MKRLCIALIFLAPQLCHAQRGTITIEVHHSRDTNVAVTLPVNGTFFPATRIQHRLLESKVSIPNTVTKAALLIISNNNRGYQLFIEPGQSMVIQIDEQNTAKRFTYSGLNEAGQYLLNQYKHTDYQGNAATYNQNASSAAVLNELISGQQKKEEDAYRELRTKGEISHAFWEFIQADIRSFYAAAASMAIFDKYEEPGYAELWPIWFQKVNMNDPLSPAGFAFFDFLDQYATWFKGSYTSKKNGTFRVFDMRKSNEYLFHLYGQYAGNISGVAREYALARFMQQFLSFKKYEPEFIELFERFKKDYPKSTYLPYLQPEINEVLRFTERSKVPFSAVQAQVLPDYLRVKSFDELLARSKGKLVYVDLWATWCGPCKEEFEHKNKLHQLLATHRAEAWYLSIDDDARDQQWKDMIKFYELSGLHLRCSPELKADLASRVWKGRATTIPRYLILKDGVLVNDNAARISSGNLEKQLKLAADKD